LYEGAYMKLESVVRGVREYNLDSVQYSSGKREMSNIFRLVRTGVKGYSPVLVNSIFGESAKSTLTDIENRFNEGVIESFYSNSDEDVSLEMMVKFVNINLKNVRNSIDVLRTDLSYELLEEGLLSKKDSFPYFGSKFTGWKKRKEIDGVLRGVRDDRRSFRRKYKGKVKGRWCRKGFLRKWGREFQRHSDLVVNEITKKALDRAIILRYVRDIYSNEFKDSVYRKVVNPFGLNIGNTILGSFPGLQRLYEPNISSQLDSMYGELVKINRRYNKNPRLVEKRKKGFLWGDKVYRVRKRVMKRLRGYQAKFLEVKDYVRR